MRKVLFSLLLLLFVTSYSMAKTWTVDNHPGANYNSLAAAQSAATSGITQ